MFVSRQTYAYAVAAAGCEHGQDREGFEGEDISQPAQHPQGTAPVRLQQGRTCAEARDAEGTGELLLPHDRHPV